MLFDDLVALLPEKERQAELVAVHEQRKDRPSDFPVILPRSAPVRCFSSG